MKKSFVRLHRDHSLSRVIFVTLHVSALWGLLVLYIYICYLFAHNNQQQNVQTSTLSLRFKTEFLQLIDRCERLLQQLIFLGQGKRIEKQPSDWLSDTTTVDEVYLKIDSFWQWYNPWVFKYCRGCKISSRINKKYLIFEVRSTGRWPLAHWHATTASICSLSWICLVDMPWSAESSPSQSAV